jgi:hypothetical protein
MGDENDRCQRWRKIAIDQLGYLVNLTLAFAIGALGYCFVLLKDQDFTPTDSAKGAMMLSISALVLSAIFGFICAVVRLLDFRGTARRACDHPNNPTKEEMRDLDNWTWVLFYVQLAAFATGVGVLAFSLLRMYGGKLC